MEDFSIQKVRRVQDAVTHMKLDRPVVPLDLVENMQGRAATMDFVAGMLATNFKTPLIGDVVVLLSLCSMGATVRSDRRARVSAVPDKLDTMKFRRSNGNGPSPSVSLDDGTSVLLANLLPSGEHARTWIHVS